jgi:hypothetical protein
VVWHRLPIFKLRKIADDTRSPRFNNLSEILWFFFWRGKEGGGQLLDVGFHYYCGRIFAAFLGAIIVNWRLKTLMTISKAFIIFNYQDMVLCTLRAWFRT